VHCGKLLLLMLVANLPESPEERYWVIWLNFPVKISLGNKKKNFHPPRAKNTKQLMYQWCQSFPLTSHFFNMVLTNFLINLEAVKLLKNLYKPGVADFSDCISESFKASTKYLYKADQCIHDIQNQRSYIKAI
jgi:hypothetical protein